MDSLIGYGNHGRDIAVIYDRSHHRGFLSIYDDNGIDGILAPPSDLDGSIIIGVNDSRERRRLAGRFALPGAKPVVDPSAIIGQNVVLGRGVIIAPQALLLCDVTLGAHVHCNYHVSMTRCKVGTFSTVSPGAVICGNVEIGEATTIGAGAVICERTTIGNEVIVGAGATVPPYSIIPDQAIVKGVWKNVH